MKSDDLKNEVLKIITGKNSKNFSRVFKYTYPAILDELIKHTKVYNPINLNEMIYIIVNGPPKLCQYGKYKTFNTYDLGYRIGCGSRKNCKCSQESQSSKLTEWHQSLTIDQKQDMRIASVKTFTERYGTSNPMKNSIIKNKVKETNLEKYGVDWAIKSNEVKIKIKDTIKNRYGVEFPLQSNKIQQKGRDTTIDRYGKLMTHARDAAYKKYNGNPFNDVTVQSKVKETMLDKYGVKHALQNNTILHEMYKNNKEKWNVENYSQIGIPIIAIELLTDPVKFAIYAQGKTVNQLHDELKYSTTVLYKYIKKHNITGIVHPKSLMELDMKQWLDFIGISYQQNNRSILSNNLELDFYLPDYNIAIELHGLFHHSEIGCNKTKEYHYMKYKGCQMKNIQLLQIWQSEYWTKKDIIQSKILYLCKQLKNKIHARKCTIKLIDDVKLEREFLNKNHIQGFPDYRSYSMGAYFDHQLVGIMQFAKLQGRWELVRYATDINVVISGLFSKLLKYSIENIVFDTNIISFSDNRISNGNLYMQSGFIYDKEIQPGYYYTDYSKIYNKQGFMKQRLLKKFNLDTEYVSSHTEWEIVQELGYDRLWDCGKIKWKYIVK